MATHRIYGCHQPAGPNGSVALIQNFILAGRGELKVIHGLGAHSMIARWIRGDLYTRGRGHQVYLNQVHFNCDKLCVPYYHVKGPRFDVPSRLEAKLVRMVTKL